MNESARAQFLASEEARRGVVLSLVGEVAQAYFELLELDEEHEIATRTTNSFAESLRIFSQRFEGGVVSKLETSRAEAALATTAAIVPDLERRIVVSSDLSAITSSGASVWSVVQLYMALGSGWTESINVRHSFFSRHQFRVARSALEILCCSGEHT